MGPWQRRVMIVAAAATAAETAVDAVVAAVAAVIKTVAIVHTLTMLPVATAVQVG